MARINIFRTSARGKGLRKSLRIAGYSLGGLVGLVLLAAVLVPILFKEQILQSVKNQANNRLNAVVEFTDVNVSLLRNFPDVSISLEGLRISGKGDFQFDTLISAQEITLAADLWSVIGGGEVEVRRVFLNQPNIRAIVLADGRANWDNILLPDTTVPDTAVPDTARPLAIRLKKYKIVDGNIVYLDKQSKLLAKITNLNHVGSGDMAENVFDIDTDTEIASLVLEMDGDKYANELKIDANVNLSIDLNNNKYTFNDNRFALNDLHLGLDGFVAMPDSHTMSLDLRFQALETSFKNILSVVPGVFTKNFEDIKTEGTLALNGFMKGNLTDSLFPTFELKLLVADAMFQYPDLPTPVTGIGVDLHVYNSTSLLDNTVIDLKSLVANMGPNPINARFRMEGLTAMRFDAKVLAQADLENLMTIFPIEGMVLKGKMNANVTANGTLADSILPAMNGTLSFKHGYVKSADFPEALSNLNFEAAAQNPTGRMADMRIQVPNFHAELGNNPFDATLNLADLNDPQYNLSLKGNLDLGKLAKILALKDMELAGLLDIDIRTEGRLSLVQAAHYASLPTSGRASVRNLTYKSKDFPQGMTIATADLAFTPANAELRNYKGTLGKSDLALQGHVDNYIGYLFKGQPIAGALQLTSNAFDVNEWMTEGSAEAETTPDPNQQMEVFVVPKNIDFLLDTRINRVLYADWVITNLKGALKMGRSVLELSGLGFNLLGGRFGLSASYDTQNEAQPAFRVADLRVDSLDFQKASQHISLVDKLAPLARFSNGFFNAQMSLSGRLDHRMQPIAESFVGGGSIRTDNIQIQGFRALEKMAQATRLDQLRNLNLSDIAFAFLVDAGNLIVKPFDVRVGQMTLNVQGSNSLDRSINYTIKVDAPAGVVGQAARGAIAQTLGQQVAVPDRYRFSVLVDGTTDNPKVRLRRDGESGDENAAGNLLEQGRSQVREGLQDARDEGREKLEAARRQAEERAQQERDRLQQEADRRRQEAEARAEAERERLRQEAERRRQENEQRLREEAERRRREQEDRLRDRFQLPR